MTNVSLDELLVHAPWVRRLATELVRDAAAADDLAQEVWLTVMRGAPPSLRNPKAWLASVARSLAFTDARARRRRTAREALRGPGEDAPAPDDVVAEAELERSVAARVLALPEPYRTVVLMRFYRDQKPAEIAQALGRPVATVKVQLQRGLEKLREELDREHGGSAKWCLLLAPLLLRRSPDAALVTSVVAWAVLLGAGLWLVRSSERDSRLASASAVAAPDTSAVVEAQSAPLAVDANADRREAESQPTIDASPPKATPTALWRERDRVTVRGRLVGLDGTPLAAVQLAMNDPGRLRLADDAHTALVAESLWLPVPRELRNPGTLEATQLEEFLAANFEAPADARALLSGLALEPELARTDARGEFEVRACSPLVRPASRNAGLIVVGRLGDERSHEPPIHVWVAVHTRRLVVRCVSLQGLPLANLKVVLAAQPVSGALEPFSSEATSDANGELAFDEAPACEVLLSTRSPFGEVEAQFAPPAANALWSVVFVAPMEHQPRTLAGRALRPDGHPARHGSVFFSDGRAAVQADGSFELSFSNDGDVERLMLVEPGFDPLVLEDLAGRFSMSSTRWDVGALTLPNSQNVLEGVVLDATGQPVANAIVSLSNPTRVAALDRVESLESLAGGYVLGGVRTDEQGRFELRGLLPRKYELAVLVDGASVRAGPFEVGARDLVLRP